MITLWLRSNTANDMDNALSDLSAVDENGNTFIPNASSEHALDRVDGTHANLRLTESKHETISGALSDITIPEPETPNRVWA